jgi:hypothetical protein
MGGWRGVDPPVKPAAHSPPGQSGKIKGDAARFEGGNGKEKRKANQTLLRTGHLSPLGHAQITRPAAELCR